jgi:hypothetical protein
MAQRLEAALRRPNVRDESRMAPPPSKAEPKMPEPTAEPKPVETKPEETAPSNAAPENVSSPPAPTEQPAAARTEEKPAQQKSIYDSLEQEMASLLGRPEGKG